MASCSNYSPQVRLPHSPVPTAPPATLRNAANLTPQTPAGFSPASLVDVDWRLDYNVMTSGTGREHDPRYLMRLRALQSDGTPADVEFTCTSEQLRDMLNQVRGPSSPTHTHSSPRHTPLTPIATSPYSG